MKFGSQIQNRSVPEWRLNNIDYKMLKDAVKKVTTFKPDKVVGSSVETDKELRGLQTAFREQFRSVNAFVSLKIKEASTRLVSVESSIFKLQRRPAGPAKRNRRKLELIRLHLDHCNVELLRICRFLILQKIALRKLLKKFIKYYPYGQPMAEEFVRTLKGCSELTEGEDGISFTKVDLDSYLLEISLILDVLQDLEQSYKKSENNNHEPEALSERSPSPSSIAPKVSAQASFDAAFLGKASRLQSFLVAEESVSQMKFLLLQLGFHVVDDDMVTASQQSIENTSTSNLTNLAYTGKSPRSFQDLHSALEQEHVPNPLHALSEIRSSQRVSVTLFDSNPVPKFLDNEAENQYPNLAIKSLDADNCVVMCHVGGLRNHVTADNLPYHLFQSAISNEEATDTKNYSGSLTPMNKLCLEWLKSHSMEICDPEIKTKRTRFSKTAKEGNGFEYFACVDEEIVLNGSTKVPHALLEIRRQSSQFEGISKSTKDDEFIVALIEKLLEFKLMCCPLAKELTLWKLLYLIRDATPVEPMLVSTIYPTLALNTSDSMFATGAAELSKIVSDKNHKRSRLNTKRSLSSKKSCSSSPKLEPQRVRYWNEFDDGDEAGQGNDSFYLDEETQAGITYGKPFIAFNKNFVNAMYDLSESLKSTFSFSKVPAERRPLLEASRRGASLETIPSFSTLNTSQSDSRDFERYMGYIEQEEDSEYAYEYKHDCVVTFFYLTSLLISSITSGISLGIVVSIFQELSDDRVLGPSTGVATIIITTLLVSLLLSFTSLLLLFSRYKLAPWWHYMSCFLIFLIVAFTVCYGIVEIFL